MDAPYLFRPLCSVDWSNLTRNDRIETHAVCLPDRDFSFLHEAAAIRYNGRIFAAWYQNGKKELTGETPIFWSTSDDGGKTFREKRLLITDPTARILYCPPVFGICDGKLYMLINEMLEKPDHIHALDLFVYDDMSDTFTLLWSRPIPFKLNTNVYRMDNGKLLLPGRIAEPDGFPNTPAVLISDSGKIDATWRLVRVMENGDLPDGTAFRHPEQSAILEGNRITLFCRTDRNIVPLLFVSEDFGETWSAPIQYDVPICNSKIYSGTLSDGRHYWIGNIGKTREKLCLLISEPNSLHFTAGMLLQDGPSERFPGSGRQWSYPVAFEADEALYVIYTASLGGDDQSVRGAVLSMIPFSELPKAK